LASSAPDAVSPPLNTVGWVIVAGSPQVTAPVVGEQLTCPVVPLTLETPATPLEPAPGLLID
jgi:hypothetical protein